MKIRKSILAAATAATVSVSGVVAAPAFAADEPAKDENVTTEDNNKNESEGKKDEGKKDEDKKDQDKKDEDKSFGAKLKANSSDDNGDWDPKAITAWISVFTAVLGLVGSVITFAQKNFKLPF